tara:strand:- start:706 stop:933 length:228 start_codon:yes stop_codon:yes gene_type:complete
MVRENTNLKMALIPGGLNREMYMAMAHLLPEKDMCTRAIGHRVTKKVSEKSLFAKVYLMRAILLKTNEVDMVRGY